MSRFKTYREGRAASREMAMAGQPATPNQLSTLDTACGWYGGTDLPSFMGWTDLIGTPTRALSGPLFLRGVDKQMVSAAIDEADMARRLDPDRFRDLLTPPGGYVPYGGAQAPQARPAAPTAAPQARPAAPQAPAAAPVAAAQAPAAPATVEAAFKAAKAAVVAAAVEGIIPFAAVDGVLAAIAAEAAEIIASEAELETRKRAFIELSPETIISVATGAKSAAPAV